MRQKITKNCKFQR